jgi:hypothetical protein
MVHNVESCFSFIFCQVLNTIERQEGQQDQKDIEGRRDYIQGFITFVSFSGHHKKIKMKNNITLQHPVACYLLLMSLMCCPTCNTVQNFS